MDGLENITKSLRPLAVEISTLHPDPRNARKHNEKNIQAVMLSLSRFGQRLPIVVQKQGMIVRAGNARLEAMKRLGWTHAAALVIDETNIEAAAFAIADNRTAELGTWDEDQLADLIKELSQDSMADVLNLGFSGDEIGELLADDTELDELETKGPPSMAWVLVGVPLVRFGEIAQLVEKLAAIDGVQVESTVSDYAGQPQTGSPHA